MTYQDILSQVKAGKMSAYTAKQTARNLPDFTDAMLTEISAAHEAVMRDVCGHQDKMDRVQRRGY
jgi:hypothetical protein